MKSCFHVSEDNTCRNLKLNMEFVYLIPYASEKTQKRADNLYISFLLLVCSGKTFMFLSGKIV